MIILFLFIFGVIFIVQVIVWVDLSVGSIFFVLESLWKVFRVFLLVIVMYLVFLLFLRQVCLGLIFGQLSFVEMLWVGVIWFFLFWRKQLSMLWKMLSLLVFSEVVWRFVLRFFFLVLMFMSLILLFMKGQKMFIVLFLFLIYVIIVFGSVFLVLSICFLVFLFIIDWKFFMMIGYGQGLIIEFIRQWEYLKVVIQLWRVLFMVFFRVFELFLMGIIFVLSSFMWKMFIFCFLMFLVFM